MTRCEQDDVPPRRPSDAQAIGIIGIMGIVGIIGTAMNQTFFQAGQCLTDFAGVEVTVERATSCERVWPWAINQCARWLTEATSTARATHSTERLHQHRRDGRSGRGRAPRLHCGEHRYVVRQRCGKAYSS